MKIEDLSARAHQVNWMTDLKLAEIHINVDKASFSVLSADFENIHKIIFLKNFFNLSHSAPHAA